jgi:nicotinamidase/pyrazinamidase
MTKKLVIVVDTAVDFIMRTGKLPAPNAEDIIAPGIKYLSELKPEDTIGVLFTFDTHDPDTYPGSPESQEFPIHCVKGTPGWENVFNFDLIDRDIPVFVLEKGVFDMWEEPELYIEALDTNLPREIYDRDLFFAQTKKFYGKDLEIEVWGVCSDYCVKYAISGLVKHGFKVKTVQELCRGINMSMAEVIEQEFAGKDVS